MYVPPGISTNGAEGVLAQIAAPSAFVDGARGLTESSDESGVAPAFPAADEARSAPRIGNHPGELPQRLLKPVECRRHVTEDTRHLEGGGHFFISLSFNSLACLAAS